MHIKHAGAYDSLPSSLTKSKSEYDPEPESKSNQEYAVQRTSIKLWHDPPPNVTDIANTYETESEEGNLEDNADLTIVSQDEDKNANNPNHVSSNGNPKKLQLNGNHPLGMALSGNRLKENIKNMTKSRA